MVKSDSTKVSVKKLRALQTKANAAVKELKDYTSNKVMTLSDILPDKVITLKIKIMPCETNSEHFYKVEGNTKLDEYIHSYFSEMICTHGLTHFYDPEMVKLAIDQGFIS